MFKESSFHSLDGNNKDHYLLFEHDIDDPITALKYLESEFYKHTTGNHQTVWLRLFLHPNIDQGIINQTFLKKLQETMSCSFVYQRPRRGCCAMLVYSIINSSFAKKTDLDGNISITELQGKNLKQCWISNISSPPTKANDFKEALSLLKFFAEKHHYRLRHGLVRTWIFLKDLLNDYAAMVDARKNFFKDENISEEFMFPASTGVQGGNVFNCSKITIDALLLQLKRAEQLKEIHSSKSMPAAYTYGVAFSRAIEVIFSQKKYVYVSGTASINASGNIVFDTLENQCRQALMNFMDILEKGSANQDHIKYLIIYVKNDMSLQDAHDFISAKFSKKLPIITVEADICRDGWFVELEGVAIKEVQTDMPDFS
ncbi:MAG: hypothetical protein HUU57_00955 [Bdellovibrio sp.]|nr:hypothetical protein [Bdellovibrio sp.]